MSLDLKLKPMLILFSPFQYVSQSKVSKNNCKNHGEKLRRFSRRQKFFLQPNIKKKERNLKSQGKFLVRERKSLKSVFFFVNFTFKIQISRGNVVVHGRQPPAQLELCFCRFWMLFLIA